jgi:DnaJ-class molecular chaperone
VARVLSSREQRALDDLIALGAELPADFTFDELRSAFRTLARRYHPDRHAGCRAEDKARLAHLFARTRDAYRTLATGR